MSRAYIGVGSNIAPEENIRQALRGLARFVRLLSISTFFREQAIDRPEEPEFYNGVVAIDTDLRAGKLKREVLRPIEAALGWSRSADKYASRTIDLDLLLYDNEVSSGKGLSLPDPNIVKRRFIAIPLYELAPELVLPGSGLPIRQVAERFAAERMQPMREYTRQWRGELLTPKESFHCEW